MDSVYIVFENETLDYIPKPMNIFEPKIDEPSFLPSVGRMPYNLTSTQFPKPRFDPIMPGITIEPKELKGKKAKVVEAEVIAPQEEKKRGRKAKEVAVDGAEPVLTDRQKARERKAKEKALLKEFAAQQLGTEEQQELRRSRLKTLIKMGMSKGYLTHGEMNDVMSDELSDADALETLIRLEHLVHG